jgi:hypothetical protein
MISDDTEAILATVAIIRERLERLPKEGWDSDSCRIYQDCMNRLACFETNAVIIRQDVQRLVGGK